MRTKKDDVETVLLFIKKEYEKTKGKPEFCSFCFIKDNGEEGDDYKRLNEIEFIEKKSLVKILNFLIEDEDLVRSTVDEGYMYLDLTTKGLRELGLEPDGKNYPFPKNLK